MTRTTIETHPTGTYFDFADPRPEMIYVEDIARALSQINRFGGHTRWPYSVAQHALLVARLVREAGGSPELCFAALHHDSHEAYLGDAPTPLKDIFKVRAPGVWEMLVSEIDVCVGRRFGIPRRLFSHAVVKAADAAALRLEAAVLKESGGVGAHWPATHSSRPDIPTGALTRIEPEWAEHLFLAAHRRALAAVS